jgi:hypothetical protein
MADGVHASMQKVDAAAGEPAVVCARAEAEREQLTRVTTPSWSVGSVAICRSADLNRKIEVRPA